MNFRTSHDSTVWISNMKLCSTNVCFCLQVWKWPSGECQVLQGHKEQVRCFALLSSSSNDSRLLSWSFDGTVKVEVAPRLHFEKLCERSY